jgi:hypothetical protein
MTALSHQGLYRNTPLVLGGLLASIALLVGGVAASMQVARTGDELLPLIFGALGMFVLVFVVCMLMALRRHRWTIEGHAVLIEERPLVPLTGRRRVRRVSFAEIAGLSSVQNAADDLLTLTTRDGARFMLPPSLSRGQGLVRAPDQAGLDSFAGALQAAIAAAGGVAPPVTDGLGFWNRSTGLALLGITLRGSLVLAGVALWGMWEGAAARHRGGEAVAILVMLPVGVAWMLRRAWRRRRTVLRALSQS